MQEAKNKNKVNICVNKPDDDTHFPGATLISSIAISPW